MRLDIEKSRQIGAMILVLSVLLMAAMLYLFFHAYSFGWAFIGGMFFLCTGTLGKMMMEMKNPRR